MEACYCIDQDNYIAFGSDGNYYMITIHRANTSRGRPLEPLVTFEQIDINDFVYKGKRYKLVEEAYQPLSFEDDGNSVYTFTIGVEDDTNQ